MQPVGHIQDDAVDADGEQHVGERLRRSEAYWRGLFERLTEGFMIVRVVRDDGGVATSWLFEQMNAAWECISGLSRESARGRDVREVLPDVEQAWVERYIRVAESGEATSFRQALDSLDQVYEVRAYPIDDDRVAVFFREVSEEERRTARRSALLELSDRLRDLDDPSDHAAVAAELLGRVLGVERVGYGDVVGDSVHVHGDWTAAAALSLSGTHDLRDYGSYVDDLKRGATVVIADAREDSRTSASAHALEALGARSMVNVPVLERGVLKAILFFNAAEARSWSQDDLEFVREVAERTRIASERCRAERMLEVMRASLEAQVAKRSRDLLRAEDALRQSQKLEAIGQLTGGVAHDFNNLLTVIKSSTDLLKRPKLAEERRVRYIDAISDTADRAAKLTAQLLAFARRQALKPEVFDVNRSVAGLVDMLGTLTGSRIDVSLRVAEVPCHVDADPSQFDTALVNMAVNARDSMNGQGQIDIAVRLVDSIPAVRAHAARDGDFVAVSIADTGAGIPPDGLSRIFEPFFFTTKNVGQGTGLGLSQVLGFAKQSGGEVTVESELGIGTTFVLYLPRAATQVAEAASETVSQQAGGEGLRVLLVEDNEDVGGFATQTLAEIGFRATWAHDAAQGLAELAQGADCFDVVFSDVVMPGMSGIEFAEEVRRLGYAVPVVLTSGYSSVLVEEGTRGLQLLHKPYSINDLSRILRQAVTNHKSAPST